METNLRAALPLGRFLDLLSVFLGAFLLFQIQPMVSKYILPWFGGAPLVWATCLVFFQLLLLAGYGYAHLLVSRVPPRGQALLHAALLLASLTALPGIPSESWKPTGGELPTTQILAMLAASIGLPYFALSSTSPLVQAWIARHRHHLVPYRLFSLSNLASILGLLSYPFLIEPAIGLRQQFFAWSALYALYALGMLSLIAYTFLRSHPAPPSGHPLPADAELQPLAPSPTAKQRLVWLGLAACPSLLFLAFTNHLTQDVAPVPFLWVLPLVIYLLTFVICFEYPNRLPLGFLRWASVALMVVLALSFLLPILVASYIPEMILYCGSLLVIGLFCHGELYARRPAPQSLTAFYLMVSAGGALGGSFVGLVAPFLFSGYYEIYAGLALCGVLAFLVEMERAKTRKPGKFELAPATAVPLFAAALAAAIPFAMAGENHIRAARNFFGAITVTSIVPQDSSAQSGNEAYRRLDHGSTRHGLQFAYPPRRCEPTTYFGPDGGAGLLLNTLRETKPAIRVGIIGLGIGTLAAYARPADAYVFYEINPLIETIAHDDFAYLSECSPGAAIRIGDARVELEKEAPNAYDVFIVDAFSGDSIPTHLLTEEAFRLYRKHLAPNGSIALNISNRYLQLAPVVAAGAEAIGFEAKFILNPGNEDLGTFTSHWAILSAQPELFDAPALRPRIASSAQPETLIHWTDDYSNLFRVLR
ncbi:MAG: fused MFS/spermidine synthase [Bryobacterales bacterium]|nr:fused MFS/spermidine synthase [Bryobacterales bacterium]